MVSSSCCVTLEPSADAHNRHKADFDSLRKDPEAIKLKREEWVLNHDAEANAYKVFDEVISSLQA